MSIVKISWVEQDVSEIELSPMERLMALTRLSENTPADEPWLAIFHPTSRSKKYYLMAISLDAYWRFSDDLIKDFSLECKKILEYFDHNEISEMRNEEISKGNPGDLFNAQERLLRLFVPSHFLPKAKKRILNIFQRIPGDLTEKAYSD
ncbi:hypothetical protein ACFL27_02750 [candidate division CSSED10-310 bacterium]|uniref:Uncharacterized protein n=1 Tax=candidate division CSSED10-310 bacterium TaxID=2855610 RepID=A0ABV6YSC3_UNCC1